MSSSKTSFSDRRMLDWSKGLAALRCWWFSIDTQPAAHIGAKICADRYRKPLFLRHTVVYMGELSPA
jgi:hypothetical protein